MRALIVIWFAACTALATNVVGGTFSCGSYGAGTYGVGDCVSDSSGTTRSGGGRHSGKELFAAAEMTKPLLERSQLITDSGTKTEIIRSYERRSA